MKWNKFLKIKPTGTADTYTYTYTYTMQAYMLA